MPARALLLRITVLLYLAAGATLATARADDQTAISPSGEQLARFLDAMDVEHLWLAHTRVNWKTGEATEPSGNPEHATHCSAFVAAACHRLDVPILHPPEHSQKLLANAQYSWLKEEGTRHGWRPVESAGDAQSAANHGQLVVAAVKNPQPDHPGHIAIVRPASKTTDQLAAEGPDVIQAGLHNHRLTSVRQGFASHPLAFENGEVAYFAHRIAEIKDIPPPISPPPAAPAPL